MATQEEIQLRLQKMLELFDEHPEGIKKDELFLALGVKARTAENMRNSLCQSGYRIETRGRGTGVWWRDKAAEEGNSVLSEPASTALHAEAAIYLYFIQTGCTIYTKESLFQKVRSLDTSVEEEDRKMMHASQSEKYNKIIDILIDEGHIKLVKHNDGKEYIEQVTEDSRCIPVMSSALEEEFQDDAYELLEYLQNYSGRLDDNLLSVKAKLEMIIDGELKEKVRSYEVRGRHSDTSSIVADIKRCFGDSDYRQNAIYIKYRNRQGIVVEKNLKVGLLYYSKIQNRIYLLGEDADSGDVLNLLLSGIETVKQLNKKNDVYLSTRYETIFDKMFGVSYDGEEHEVEVTFEIFGSVPDKIRQLSNTRRYSSCREEGGKLVYTDRIIGLSEFAAYLRQFGWSCEAVRPQKLREEMGKSPERVLNRYREEGVI